MDTELRAKMIRMALTYSELMQLPTYEKRFNYVKMDSQVGKDTFGFKRYLNQKFYHSNEWRHIRDLVIARDNGCDLAIEGYEIHGRIYIHHLNPLREIDIIERTPYLLDPEYMVCVWQATHEAIHYGDAEYCKKDIVVERSKNDTCPWKH